MINSLYVTLLFCAIAKRTNSQQITYKATDFPESNVTHTLNTNQHNEHQSATLKYFSYRTALISLDRLNRDHTLPV